MNFKPLVLAGLMVVSLCAGAFADGVPNIANQIGEKPNTNNGEVATYEFNDGVWSTPVGSTPPTMGVADAKSWNSGRADHDCNMNNVTWKVTNHASVAQWARFTMDSTRKDWRIRKPGTYASSLGNIVINSNAPVDIKFDGFGDLEKVNGLPTDPKIAAEYGYGNDINTANFYAASQLNNLDITDMPMAGTAQTFKLWAKIKVADATLAGEYEDYGSVTVSVDNSAFGWLNDGGWRAGTF